MTLSIIINTASMLAAPVFIHSDVALQITAFFLFFFFFARQNNNTNQFRPQASRVTKQHMAPLYSILAKQR